MAKKSAPAPTPLTFDLPASLLEKIESQRKRLGYNTISQVVRQALSEFDLANFTSSTEERRQISVRISFNDKAALARVAKKQKVSLGEILRAAVNAMPEKKAVEKKTTEQKAVEKKSADKKASKKGKK